MPDIWFKIDYRDADRWLIYTKLGGVVMQSKSGYTKEELHEWLDSVLEGDD